MSKHKPGSERRRRRQVAKRLASRERRIARNFVLVPIEPTTEMYAAVTADLRGADHMPGSFDLSDAGWAKRFWKAMLSATPAMRRPEREREGRERK